MELLQKLTLYDLLGYTIPGIFLLWLCNVNVFFAKLTQMKDGGSAYWWLVFIIGYIIGIVITEIIEIFIKLIVGLFDVFKLDIYYWDYLIKVYGISEEELKGALGEAKGVDIGKCNSAGEILKKYRSYIYSDIQTDEKYSRLHNYASAELLYKNMTVVFIAALLMELVNGPQPEIAIYIIGILCLAFRFIKFSERKTGYAACWFIQKHFYSDGKLGE